MSKYNLSEILNESFEKVQNKIAKQKGISKEEAAKIAGSIAAKKMKGAGKGPTAKQKARMKEELGMEERDRIDGLVNQKFLKNFLTSFGEMYIDLTQDDQFDSEDVLDYLQEEMRVMLKERGMYNAIFNIREDEEEEEEEIVQYEPFVEGETVLRRTERIDRFEYYDYIVNNKEEYDYILENGVDKFIDKYFMDEDQFEYNDIYEKILETNYNLGNRNKGKFTPIQEDLFSKDGDTEDNVDNIDSIASPSAKGRGYSQVSKANTAEDDMESKELSKPEPMFEDLKRHFKRFI